MKTTVKLFAILVSVFAGVTAHCADITWDNSSGDNLWSTPENWSTDKLPGVRISSCKRRRYS